MKVAVIGTGAAGTSFLLNLKDKLAKDPSAAKSLEIAVYEKGPRTGPGAGYNPDLNLDTDTMNLQSNEVFRNARDAFREWLARQPDDRLIELGYLKMMERQDPRLLKEYQNGKTGKTIGQLVAQREHDINPRIGVGAFMSDMFDESCDALRQMGAQVTVHAQTEVIAAKPRDGGGFTITSEGRDGTQQATDIDTLCKFTGYWEKPVPDSKPGVFYSGFPAKDVMQGADVTQPIAQLGTGVFGGEVPTKFDAGEFARGEDGRLTFTRHPGNENFKVVLFSGSGQLPAVKGRTTDYKAKYLTEGAVKELIRGNDGFLPLDDLVDLFKQEIASAAPGLAKAIPGWEKLKMEDIHAMLNRQRDSMGPRNRLAQDLAFAKESRNPDDLKPIPWQNPLMLLFVFVDEHLHALSAEDRIRFDKAAPTLLKDIELITVPTAERLVAMIDAGALEVVKARNVSINAADGHARGATVSYTDENGERHDLHFNTFVQAGSGAHPDVNLDPSRLTQSLLSEHMISPGMLRFRDQELGKRLLGQAAAQQDAHADDVARDGAESKYSTLAGRVREFGGAYYLNMGGIHADEKGRVIAPDRIGQEPDKHHAFFSMLPDKKGLHPAGGGLTIGNVRTGVIAEQVMEQLKAERVRAYEGDRQKTGTRQR